MQDLLELIKYSYQDVCSHKEELSIVKKYRMERIESEVTKNSQLYYSLFINGQFSIHEFEELFKWGNILNLDLVADFLLHLNYVKCPNGSYKVSEKEKEIIDKYYLEKEIEIKNNLSRFIFIKSFMQLFIHFARQNYDSNFFYKTGLNGSELKKSDKYVLYQTTEVAKRLLKIKKITHCEDLNTSQKILNKVREEELKKEDDLSFFIDSYDFQKVCIYQYENLKEELDTFLSLFQIIEPKKVVSSYERDFYQTFAFNLRNFIEKRENELLNCYQMKSNLEELAYTKIKH